MIHSYRTIETASEGVYKEKGSKFMAFAYPVRNEEEIKEYLIFLRKKYFDARHHCFAWVIGPEKIRFRVSDDGEPSHSAGDPILGQIKSRDLTNVLIVVVRYFGGVKLGVGGLIAAYREAAGNALDSAVIIENEIRKTFSIEYAYAETNEVMKLVDDVKATIVHQEFLERCTIQIEVPLKVLSKFEERMHFLQRVLNTSLNIRDL